MRIKALLFLIVVSISALTTVHGVAQAATFTVNSTGDTGDFSTGDGICSDGTGICTLRAAIEEANAIAGADSIAFDIPTTDIGYASSTDSFLIQPSSALPTITSPVTIDGYTQPGASANTNGPGLGSNAVLKIELDGSTAGSFITGLKITAGSSVVRGLAINRFDANGIEMSENGGNLIEGSFIGVDITGTISLGNDSHGVLVQDVSNNTFGGTTEVARNVISGNNFAGIALNGMDASGNIVQGNFVGTDLNGTIALPNRGGGVSILDSPDNILGGTEPGAGNLLSGNDQNGVTIYNVNATGNLMQGNLIGTDLTGTVGLGNGLYGVIIEDAPGNTIGGTTEAARNIISGNDSSGIVLLSRSAFENTVQGNFVGTDITGTFAIPNATHSIIIDDAPRNLIGGLTAGARNIISGNAEGGVVIGGLDATGNIVQGNFIGTDVTGTVALGNDLSGVAIQDASDNIIGGTAAARNIISGNGRSGVIIFGIDSTNNIVQGNFIGTDVTGAIAMGNDTDGVVMLDASDNTIGGSVAGEGNLISGNEGNGVLILGSSATNNLVHGNLIGTDFNGIAALGNDASGVSIQDGSSNTIGGITPEERNIISANSGSGVTISGDATGNLLQGNFIGTDVTGTIALGNSVSGVILGNTPANTIGGTATGAGNVISANSGTGIIISGVGSTGNLVQGNLVGTDLTGMIALGNTSQGVLIYGASSNTIGGATSGARNIISGNGTGGIAIVSEGATGNVVQGSYIGADATGNAVMPNNGSGIDVLADDNIIGGSAAGEGNLIVGNVGSGVTISFSSGNFVQGNFIGTNATSTVSLGNASHGVLIFDASDNLIGGDPAAGEGNIISGNGGSGVLITGIDSSGNEVHGNAIGTDIAGTVDVGNSAHGVMILGDAMNNAIGNATSSAGNIIAFNEGHGINVLTGSGNAIRFNSMFSNTGMGVDLGGFWLTSNDADDADAGANNLQNHPYMTALEIDGNGDLVIEYSVDSAPGNSAYPLSVEFFVADVDGEEGKTLLGTNIYLEASAQASVTANLGNAAALGIAGGELIVATATDAGGNTSEFSRPAMSVGGPLPPLCDGQFATIVGTEDADVLVGTVGDDVIVGLGGNDFIVGLGGNDVICGDDGNDLISGGTGDDTLVGGSDIDILVGGSGDDALDCGTGFDFAIGGDGTDTATEDCEYQSGIP